MPIENWTEDIKYIIDVCVWHIVFYTVFVSPLDWMAPLLYGASCAAFMAVLTLASPTTRADEMSVELRMPEVQPKLVGAMNIMT